MSAFSDYLASVDGQFIDVDGNYGAQCWDLWTHYSVNLIGVDPWWRCSTSVGGGCADHPGYTCGIWYGFNNSGLNQWYTSHTGSPIRGDVAIWEFGSAPAPLSHVAVVIEDRGDSVLCMTQNPGGCHYGQISKSGILGYLRPDNQSFFDGAAPAPTPAPAPSGRTHTVVAGDTLWGIAQTYLGDGTRYPEIFALSNFRSGNPNLIFPGEIAVLP